MVGVEVEVEVGVEVRVMVEVRVVVEVEVRVEVEVEVMVEVRVEVRVVVRVRVEVEVVKAPSPIAIAIADLHLSLTAPACRADKDWLDVQAGYLQQVRDLCPHPKFPVLIAGDIFDKWNPPPELINFALEHLPERCLCVAGQHDLPNHRMDHMHRSGYGVLVETGRILNLTPNCPFTVHEMSVYGFGWNEKITPPRARRKNAPQIALIHQYCWTVKSGYPGAPAEARLVEFMKPLKDYGVAVFGDNHEGFLKNLKTGTTVLNCGTFIRRKSDEIKYKPSVGFIYSDGSIKREYLDTSGDVFHDKPEERQDVPLDMQAFIEQLQELGEHGLNFREAVENHLRKADMDEETKQIILEAIK